MECYSLTVRPFYKSCSQCYIKVIQIDRQPPKNAIINQILKRTYFNKLSPFDSPSPCEKVENCGIILMNPNNISEYATIDEIPLIFTWLMQNGYMINTSITEMMNSSSVKQKYPLLCMVTK